MDRLANENAAGEIRPEQLITIRRGAARRCDVPGHADVVKSLQNARSRKNARGVLIIREHPSGRANSQVRIPSDVLFGNEIMPDPRAVIVPKPIAPIIAMTTILRIAGLCFESPISRTKTEIASVNIHCFSHQFRSDASAAIAIGTVKPVVEPIFESVDPMLLIAFPETGEKNFAHVRFAVAVRVLSIKYFGRGTNDHPPSPGHDSR